MPSQKVTGNDPGIYESSEFDTHTRKALRVCVVVVVVRARTHAAAADDDAHSPTKHPPPKKQQVAKGFANACRFQIYYAGTCPANTTEAPKLPCGTIA